MEEIVLPFFVSYRRHFKSVCGDWLIHAVGNILGLIGVIAFYILYISSETIVFLVYASAIGAFIGLDLIFMALVSLYWLLYMRRRKLTEVVFSTSGIFFDSFGNSSLVPWSEVRECYEARESLILDFDRIPSLVVSKDLLIELNSYLSLKKLLKLKGISVLKEK